MHRNTIREISLTYDENRTEQTELLLKASHMTIEEIKISFGFFRNQSRKPKTYRGVAPPSLEKIVCDEYDIL